MNKPIIVLLILVCFGGFASAENAQGYIVTLKSDTVWGYIQVSRFDQVTGGLMLNGIEEESFHSRVVFCPANEKRFTAYFPEMIQGFGFVHDSTAYVFKQLIVEHKSIFKNERKQIRFVRLLGEDADIVHFKDVRIMSNPGLQSNPDKYLRFNSHHFQLKAKGAKQLNDSLRINN